MPTDIAQPRWCGEAAALLRLGVPESCLGLTPYDSHYFSRFLATCGAVPEDNRTLFLRGEIDRDRVLAVADWRLLGTVLYLNGMSVLPSVRGRGLARGLLSDGSRLARYLGASQLELDLAAGSPAEQMFQRAGFKPAGVSTWRELPMDTVEVDPRKGWRIRNWGAYVPHLQAYGFGDLDITSEHERSEGAEAGEAVAIRVLPGGWRVNRPGTAVSVVRTLAPVLGHTPNRVFTVAGTRGAGEEFVRFRRLRRTP